MEPELAQWERDSYSRNQHKRTNIIRILSNPLSLINTLRLFIKTRIRAFNRLSSKNVGSFMWFSTVMKYLSIWKCFFISISMNFYLDLTLIKIKYCTNNLLNSLFLMHCVGKNEEHFTNIRSSQ